MESEEQKPNVLESIEQRTGRAVTIEATETDLTLGKCHAQDQSPLFAVLPRELRDLIWAFTTAPFEDEEHQYKRNEFYYRPGHTARLKTNTEILFTCRKIWLEANAFPMLQAEHCFWYYRAAPDARDAIYMAKLTPLNRRNFGDLHLFAQMYTIENLRPDAGRLRKYFLQNQPRAGDFQPRMLHVTVRHTDWYHWEEEAPLEMRGNWIQALLDSPDLRSTQTLKLELETLDYKVNQLMPIVERIWRMASKEYETHIVDGQPTTTKFVLYREPELHKWTGPININDRDYPQYQDKDRLNYHVVTLTWRLQFPQLLHGHVPTLRRVPRVGAPESLTDAASVGCRVDNEFPLKPEDESYFRWKKRRRLHMRLPLAVEVEPDAMEDLTEKMMNHQLYNEKLSKWGAETHEGIRRARYHTVMKDIQANKWQERWQAEQSLLRFAT